MQQTSQRRYNMSIDFGHQRSLVTLIRSISVEWYGGKEAGVLGITQNTEQTMKTLRQLGEVPSFVYLLTDIY